MNSALSLPNFLISQIDTWCKENNYVIAGYYQANERTKDSRYGQLHRRWHTVCVEHKQICITYVCSCVLLILLLLVLLLRRPNQVAEKVAARISENFSEAAIVMVKSVHNTYIHTCWSYALLKLNCNVSILLVRSINFEAVYVYRFWSCNIFFLFNALFL